MVYRSVRLLFLSIFLTSAVVQLWGQQCPDTEPRITGPAVVCESAANVVAYSTPDVTGHNYLWTVQRISPGVGGWTVVGSSTSAQFNVRWTDVGTFRITLQEGIAGNPCSPKQISLDVTSQPFLAAYYYYTFDPLYGCYYNVVSFTGDVSLHTDPNITYSWDFGDFSPLSTLPNPIHTFPTTAGVTYTITLTIQDSQGRQDQIIDYVFVDPDKYKPDPLFTDTPVGCLYDGTMFDASASKPTHIITTETIIHFKWVWGDGDSIVLPGNQPITNHVYASPGTYNVTLTVTNSKGCYESLTLPVTIASTIPTAAFSISPACLNEITYFDPHNSYTPNGTITDLIWSFGDGSPMDTTHDVNQIVEHTYLSLGPFPPATLKVINSIGCESEIVSQPVQIFRAPKAGFDHGNACSGTPVVFTNTSQREGGSEIVAYLWNFGDGNTSAEESPTYLYSGTGTFTVTLRVTNADNCSDILTHDIIVNPNPDVDFTATTGTSPYQIDFQEILNPLQFVGNNLQWDFGDAQAGSGPHPTHTYGGAGDFTVTLVGTDMQTGCPTTVQHTVNVGGTPSAFFTANPPVQCQGLPISFIPGPPGGLILTEDWYFNDGSVPNPEHYDFPNTPAYPVHTFLAPNTYLVERYVNMGTATEAYYSQYVTIDPQPGAQFTWFSDASLTNQGKACANQPVYFIDASYSNSTPPGSIYKWEWNFGDPGSGPTNISNLQNPDHTFSAAGTSFDVRLIVTDNLNDCKDTITHTVIVNPVIPVDFTFNDNVCFGQMANFTTDPAILPPASFTWFWDFGDGTNSTQPGNVSHLFPYVGTFTVILTVTDQWGCFNSKTHTITVIPVPIANFTFTSPSCDGEAIAFTDKSVVPDPYPDIIVGWLWDFGDGVGTSTLQNPTYIYPAFNPGGYDVTLTVTTNRGCTASKTYHVQPIPRPAADFEILPLTPACVNQPVQFHDLTQLNGGGILTFWSWNFGDPGSGSSNTSDAQNPTHTFAIAGTYSVTLTVTNANGCKDTIVKPVLISALPVANFTNSIACQDTIMTFTDNSTTPPGTNIIFYDWNFGDGGTATGPSPQHTYSNYGNYLVTLTVVNSNGCIHDTTKQVTVNPKPVPEFSFSQTACIGNPVYYVDASYIPSGFSGYIDTWTWDFGDGTTPVSISYPNNPNISHTFAGSGSFHIVRLTVHTTMGCSNFIEKTVTSIPSPVANYSFSTTTCVNQTVQFTDLSQPNGGGNIVSWNWNFGDPGSGPSNTSTSQHPTHTFGLASPPPYDVRLIVTNVSGCVDTITQQVTINAGPTAQFTASSECLGSATVFTDQSTAPGGASIVSRLWNFDDGITSTLQNPTHTYANPGTYNVTLTVTTNQGCIKDTTKQVEVYGKPLPLFTCSSPTCSTDSVYFTDLSTTPHGSIYQWKWDLGDGSATVTKTFPESPNVVHKYANGGIFDVILTITTTDSCIATKTIPVTIQFAPLANFEFAAGACEETPLQFTDLSQPNGGGAILTWDWNFGDPASGTNNTSTAKNPTHAFTGGGTFWVLLKVTNSTGCMDTISKQVTVNFAPVAQFTADTACVASPTQFTDGSTTPSGTIITWAWNFGDPASGSQNTSSSQNPSHIYNSPGNYSVTLVVTNSSNCTNDTIIQISVNPKPQAMFQYTASCVGDSTKFTDLSIAPGSQIMAWLWNFGDGGTSTIQNPSHVYANAGTFMVTLVVTNLANCEDSVTIPVIARPKPTAAFTYINFFCPAGQVNFQDQSSGQGSAILGHLWIFEPGYTSTLVNPQHTFQVTDTTYLVTLIVTDTYGCMDTITDSVYVKPAFDFTFSNDTVCFGYRTQFHPINKAAGDSLYSVVWNFGDPNSGAYNISYLYAPTHVYTQPGMFVVKMKAWNSDNCVDSVFREIQVYAPPKPGFAFNTEPCDSTVYFTDTTNNSGTGTIASWEWRFGDGSSPVIIPAPGPGNTSHLYVNPGLYPVTLIITNTKGCLDSITTNVERFPCIRASFDYNDTLLCATYLISFSDSSLPINRINRWHWTWGDGKDTTYTSHSSPITHIYANAGIFNVTLTIRATVDGTDILDSITQQITIHPTPESYFSNLSTCLKQPSIFLDTSNTFGEPVAKWYWNFGEPGSGVKDTSTIENPSHTYAVKGIYDVKMVVMNRFGCKDSITKSTRIYGLPIAHYDNTTACTGDPTYFEDKTSISDTTIGFWKWNFGDTLSISKDTSALQNPDHKYRNPGSYSVRMIVRDFFGCMDTVDSTVTVNITPTSAFTLTDNFDGKQGNVKLNNSSEGASGYNWDFGNGKTSDEENPIVTYTDDGTYIIKLISLNEFGCSDTTYFEYKLLFKGLYVPNAFSPTNDNLAVRFFKPIGTNLKQGQYHVTVFDTWGHLLWESTKLDSQGRPDEGWDGTYNGNLMPQGTYIWKIKAMFVDDSPWNGGDIGKGEYSTMGTVTLIR